MPLKHFAQAALLFIILLAAALVGDAQMPDAPMLTPRIWLPLMQSSLPPVHPIPTMPMIVNGDFERGEVGWSQSGTSQIYCNGPWPELALQKDGPIRQKESPDYEGPWQGSCWAWQLGYNDGRDQLMTDPFRWPGHTSLFVSVAWSVTSQEGNQWPYDICLLDLIDVDTRYTLARLFVHSNTDADGQYHINRTRVVNMESLFGRRLALRFVATSDMSNITSCHYDVVEAWATDQDMQDAVTVAADGLVQ